jgi:hypothetical protein
MGDSIVNAFLPAQGASYFARQPGFQSESFAEPSRMSPGSGREFSRKWGAVIDELLAARQLEDDWDGQGAKAPTAEAVDTALRLAIYLRGRNTVPPDDFGPGVNGVMTLGWHSGARSMVIEVSSPLRVEGYRWAKADEKAERFVLLTGE